MSDQIWARRETREPAPAFPPTADEVDFCPPHHWMLTGEWQECRKCGERKKIEQSIQHGGYRWTRKPEAK